MVQWHIVGNGCCRIILPVMIRNYITAALRHLLKRKTYTLLNAFGLSIGLACATLIALWVKDELSFDTFHEKASRTYRVAATFVDESGRFDQAVTCIPLAPALETDLPEIEHAVRIDRSDAVVQLGDRKFVEDNVLGVDPSFFKIFSFQLLKGNIETALNEPYNIVISESMSKKYFGELDPIGHTLRIFLYDPNQQGAEYKVTGVVQDCPLNSHFRYDFLFSFKTIEAYDPDSFGYDGWFNNGYYTYILVKPDARIDGLSVKLAKFLEKYIGNDMKKHNINWTYFLQPLTDIHLKSNLRYELGPTTSIGYVVVFASVGLVVFLLACINYINLSTAYSSDRFKEVGVRKVIGARRNQLIGQYLMESWILAMVSLLVAFVWIELARPLFESLTGKPVMALYAPETIIPLIIIGSVAGIVSGLYPSLILSSFPTVNVLKANLKSGSMGVLLRKSLVVVQFSVTVILVTGIVVIQRQLSFIRTKDLGFNKENLLVLNVNGSSEVRTGYQGFYNELLSGKFVESVARSSSFIAGGLGNSGATFEDASGKKVNGTFYNFSIDADYIGTYKMKLLAGRTFVPGSLADSTSLIVNEATVRAYGYESPADVIGKDVLFRGKTFHLVGVVRDFNYNTLHTQVEPTCMYMARNGFSRIAVRLNGDVNEGVGYVTGVWKKHFPNSVLDHSFADDRLDVNYRSEQRFSKIFIIFSAIAVTVACLGLFSLVSFSVETRTKEIGIRKVLGATVGSILGMLSREFVVLVLISVVVAIPVAYYLMNDWLSNFAYRIDFGPSAFLAAGILVLAIAAITVAIRSMTAATANPVKALRNE